MYHIVNNFIKMATLIREYILNENDMVDEKRLLALKNAVKNKKCETITKKGKLCGRVYQIHVFGRCGCRFHEDYSHAIMALNILDDIDILDDMKKLNI